MTIDLNGTRIIDRDDPKFDKEGIIALADPRWPDRWKSGSRISRSRNWRLSGAESMSIKMSFGQASWRMRMRGDGLAAMSRKNLSVKE